MTLSSVVAVTIPVLSVAVISVTAFLPIHVRSSRSNYACKLGGASGFQRSTFYRLQKKVGYSRCLTIALVGEDGGDDVLDQLIEKFAIPLQPLDFKTLYERGASDTDGKNEDGNSDADVTNNNNFDGDATAGKPTQSSFKTADSSTSTTVVRGTQRSATEDLGSSTKKIDSITKSSTGRDSKTTKQASSVLKATNTPSNSLASTEKVLTISNPATVSASSAKKEGETTVDNSKMRMGTVGSDSAKKEDEIVVKMEEPSKSESSQSPMRESDLVVKMDDEIKSSPKKTSQPTGKKNSDLIDRIDDGVTTQGIASKSQPVAQEENELVAKMEDDITLEEIPSSKSTSKDTAITSNPNTDLVFKMEGNKNLDQIKDVVAKEEGTKNLGGDKKSAPRLSAADESTSSPIQSRDTTSTTVTPPSYPFQPFNFNSYEQDDDEIENAVTASVGEPFSLPSIPNLGVGDFGLVGGLVLGVSFYLGLTSMIKRSSENSEGQIVWDEVKDRVNFQPNLVADDKQKLTLDQSLEVDKVTDAIKEVFVDKGTTETSDRGKDELVRNFSLKAKDVEQVKSLEKPKKLSFQQQSAPRKIDSELSALEGRLSSIAQDAAKYEPIASANKPNDNTKGAMESAAVVSTRPSTSERQVKKIEEYCEAGKVNMECSSSISSYLGSLSGQRVEQGVEVAAKSTITSYLDSLSSSNNVSGRYSRSVNSLSARGAAFSSYLDALSSGEVKAAPTPKAVAGYLEKMTAETVPDDESSDEFESRIVVMEQRLSQLETSVANLPDDIASRLSDWQERQDRKIDHEMAKIRELLVDIKSDGGRFE